MKSYLSQPVRLWLMIVEIAVFWLVCAVVLGKWVIPSDGKGFYFYTGLLGLILGARIATPFFQRPADVVAYALPAAFSALLAPVSESKTPYVQDLQYGLLIFYGTVLAVAFLAIALKDAKSVFLLKVSEAFRQFSARVGAPIVIFGPLTFFALYAFHYGDPGEFLPLSLAAISLILLSPFEALVISVRKLRGALTEISGDAIGEIVGIQLPGIVLVRGGGRMPEHGQILPAKDPYCPSGRLWTDQSSIDTQSPLCA